MNDPVFQIEPPPGRRTWLYATIAGAVVVAGVAIVLASLPDGSEGTTSVLPPADVGIAPKFGAVVPGDLVFADEQGNTVRLGDFIHDRPVILALVYFECPMLCNLTMDGMVRGLRAVSQDIGTDYTVLTVSFDPREGPQLAAAAKKTAMTRYGREGAAAGWHFLTGQPEPILKLTDAVGFRFVFDEQSGQYAHGAGLFVLTPEGKVSRFLGGVEFAPRDLQMALSEASAGSVGTLTDQVLLLCFHYDPATGKYGLAIFRILQFAGLVTVCALAAGIFMLSRQGSPSPNPSHQGRGNEERDG